MKPGQATPLAEQCSGLAKVSGKHHCRLVPTHLAQGGCSWDLQHHAVLDQGHQRSVDAGNAFLVQRDLDRLSPGGSGPWEVLASPRALSHLVSLWFRSGAGDLVVFDLF
jgi:sirohydrochlorin ferrochelatase